MNRNALICFQICSNMHIHEKKNIFGTSTIVESKLLFGVYHN